MILMSFQQPVNWSVALQAAGLRINTSHNVIKIYI